MALDDTCLERMHEQALRIAEELGLAVSHRGAQRRLQERGVRVESGRAYIPGATIQEFVDRYRQRRLSEAERQSKGARPMGMVVMLAAQYDLDLDTDEIVPITTERLIQQVKAVHAARQAGMRVQGLPIGIPADVSPAMVPLIEFLVCVQYSDQPPAYCWNWPQRTQQYLRQMHRVLGHGGEVRGETYVLSPLRLEGNLFEMLMERLDECDRFYVYTHGMMGANLPVRPFAAMAVSVAEALAAATAIWLMSGGKPVEFHVCAVPFDVRYLTQLYHGPEEQLLEILRARVAEYYGRPGEGSSHMVTLAKRPGFQAGLEKAVAAMWGMARGATQLVGAGALSREEIFSAEQLVLDWEICSYVERVRQGLAPENPEDWLSEARAGLGGSYTGADTTLDHYQEVYWQPELLDRLTLMPWRARGEPQLRQRARARARQLLASYDYEPPADTVRELQAIVEVARRELG